MKPGNFGNYFILVVFGLLMCFSTFYLPNRGDVDTVVQREQSPAGTPGASAVYIHKSMDDAKTDNMVTVILADYRGYDTLGEETVIFTAGMMCFLLLRKREKKDEKGGKE